MWRLMIRAIAAGRASPSAKPASTCPLSLRNTSKARRAVNVWAVIAPPMMIPAIGMIAAPVKRRDLQPEDDGEDGEHPGSERPRRSMSSHDGRRLDLLP